MREQIIKYQTLQFINKIIQIKKAEIVTYNNKLNRMEINRRRGLNTNFDENLYELTKTRYNRIKEVDSLLGQLWRRKVS